MCTIIVSSYAHNTEEGVTLLRNARTQASVAALVELAFLDYSQPAPMVQLTTDAVARSTHGLFSLLLQHFNLKEATGKGFLLLCCCM
jgi:hypothetical protein